MTTQAGTRVPTADSAHRPARWVRTRLRANPLAALLMAALAFVTVFLAAAFPRVTDRGADAALQDFVRQKGLHPTSLQTASKTRDDETADSLDRVQRHIVEQVGGQLTLDRRNLAYGARALGSHSMANPGYAHLSDKQPYPDLGLLYLHDLPARATLTEGTWPTVGTADGPLPIVISEKSAETIHIKLGDVIDNGIDDVGAARTTVVVGLYRLNDPQDPFWDDLGCPDRACLNTQPEHERWFTTGFVGDGGVAGMVRWGSTAESFWRLSVDPASLHADRIDETRGVVTSFLTGRDATALVRETGRTDLRTSSSLPEILTQADARYRATLPLSTIGPAGAAGVTTVVLFLAAALTTDRRAAEIRLLRARGGSLAGVLRRLLAEGAVTVLPAAALGTVLALVLLPTVWWERAVLAALIATLIALLAFPARAALLWARPRPAGGRARGRRRPARPAGPRP
ncbi:ABC transporter permease, partial [Kitasatospora sp. NPDC002543]